MFKWEFTETIETDATPEQIWSLWENVNTWPLWDKEISWVKLHGPFLAGTHGQMKPIDGPKVNFTLIEVEKNKKFIDQAKLPLTVMNFSHFYHVPTSEGGKSTIQHHVEIKGLLAPLFGFIIGRKIKKHLKQAMICLSTQSVVN